MTRSSNVQLTNFFTFQNSWLKLKADTVKATDMTHFLEEIGYKHL